MTVLEALYLCYQNICCSSSSDLQRQGEGLRQGWDEKEMGEGWGGGDEGKVAPELEKLKVKV